MNHQSFDKIWSDVPEDQRTLYQDFRASHPYIEFDFENLRGRYISCGRGAKTLIFLPGAFVDADIWIHSILAFENDYRIIAPSRTSKTLQMDRMPDFICKIFERERVDKATFIGASAGGGAAQYFLQHRPEKVEHLVLSHCTAMSRETARGVERTLKILRFLPLPLIHLMLKARSKKYPASSSWAKFTKAYASQFYPTLDKATIMGFLKAGAEASEKFLFDPEVVRTWGGEILIISSKDDKMSFPRLHELKARYPKARTHILEEGGHASLMLFPETCNAVIRTFLNQVYENRSDRA